MRWSGDECGRSDCGVARYAPTAFCAGDEIPDGGIVEGDVRRVPRFRDVELHARKVVQVRIQVARVGQVVVGRKEVAV